MLCSDVSCFHLFVPHLFVSILLHEADKKMWEKNKDPVLVVLLKCVGITETSSVESNDQSPPAATRPTTNGTCSTSDETAASPVLILRRLMKLAPAFLA